MFRRNRSMKNTMWVVPTMDSEITIHLPKSFFGTMSPNPSVVNTTVEK